jgi:DNA polymerase (family 10)
LGEIPGIGKALEEKIIEFFKSGSIDAYERLLRDVPESLLDVMNVPSVGPKKAKIFFKQLGVKTVDDLKRVASEGKLLGLPGFKEKTVENILKGIAVLKEGQKRLTILTATEVAHKFVESLKVLPQVKRIDVAGSLRRCKETIGDIDILVAVTMDEGRGTKDERQRTAMSIGHVRPSSIVSRPSSSDAKTIMDAFVRLPQVKSINAHGETKSSVLTQENIQVDLRVVSPEVYGAALLHLTGSQAFNVKLRQLAIKNGMKVSEYGVFKMQGEKEHLIACDTEEKCFKALGLPFFPPELREEIGEEEIFSGKKPPELITLDDIKGDLHTHSTYSDGRNTIEEMAAAAQALGYEYLALSDHSQKLKIARGVSQEDLLKKIKHIEGLNKKLKGFRVLCGSEVEIDSDGNLDYNEDTLARLDFVIASVHSGFEQTQEKMTQRLAKTCTNKYVHAIGHPFGRHIGKRDGYNIDFRELCRVATDTNTCLEINAFPIRLDLDSANAYFARHQGVKFLINTDAHAIEHLSYMKFGVGVARRAWLRKEDVINTRSLKDLEKALRK